MLLQFVCKTVHVVYNQNNATYICLSHLLPNAYLYSCNYHYCWLGYGRVVAPLCPGLHTWSLESSWSVGYQSWL